MSNQSELSELIKNLKEIDPRTATDEAITAGERWADDDGAASTYEETRKSLLAKLTLEYMSGGVSSAGGTSRTMPVNQAELRALTDIRYESHLDLMVKARKEAHRSRVRYDMQKMRLELLRSVQATLRAEARYIGNT